MSNNLKFLNLVLLKGNAKEKIYAAHSVGFNQVEIWMEDIIEIPDGADFLARQAKKLGIGFTNLQVLRDFAGAPQHERPQKRKILHQFIKIAKILGCDAIQVPANTNDACILEQIDEDLRWLAIEAARYEMRIMYEPMAWCVTDNTLQLAWKRIQRLNEPNIGLVVDLFHICALGGDESHLDGINADKIYAVQLCDILHLPLKEKSSIINTARHKRELPGNGIINISMFIDKLKNLGYRGPVGIEVFNDKLKKLQANQVAYQAWNSLNRYWP